MGVNSRVKYIFRLPILTRRMMDRSGLKGKAITSTPAVAEADTEDNLPNEVYLSPNSPPCLSPCASISPPSPLSPCDDDDDDDDDDNNNGYYPGKYSNNYHHKRTGTGSYFPLTLTLDSDVAVSGGGNSGISSCMKSPQLDLALDLDLDLDHLDLEHDHHQQQQYHQKQQQHQRRRRQQQNPSPSSNENPGHHTRNNKNRNSNDNDSSTKTPATTMTGEKISRRRTRLVRIVSWASIKDRCQWTMEQERELVFAEHELARCQKAWSSEQELWLAYIKALNDEKEAHDDFLHHRAKQQGDEQHHFRKVWNRRRSSQDHNQPAPTTPLASPTSPTKTVTAGGRLGLFRGR